MLEDLDDIRYYHITSHAHTRKDIFSDVQTALDAGVRVVQYRNKIEYQANRREMEREARALKLLCEGKAYFLINDHIELALEVNADGVHVGQRDRSYQEARELLGSNKIIGVSVHTYELAIKAIDAGADYLGVGPIFNTSKEDAEAPTGIGLLTKIKSSRPHTPLVAIGGIKYDNARSVIAAGANGVCAIIDVLDQDDVPGMMRRYQELFQQRGS